MLLINIPKWHIDQTRPTNQILSDSLFSDSGMSLSEAKAKIDLMNNQYNFAEQKCQRRFVWSADERNLQGIPDGDGETNWLGRVKTGKN